MNRRWLVSLLIPVLIAALALPVLARDAKIRQIVLILWHGLEWEHLDSLQFDEPRAVGLLNTRSGGGEALTAAYLSIGAGARAVGSSGAALFHSTEGGKELYRRNTGLDPTSLVQPRIAQIRAAQTVQYRLEIGALGSALAEAGTPPRVLGSSEGHEPFHWAALVGMDGWGRVWEGSVGSEFTIQDPDYPYGVRTDYQHLAREVLQATEPLVVVDLGDPFRYDQYRINLVPSQQEKLGNLIASEVGEFLAEIVSGKAEHTVVILVSPYPSQPLASRSHWLTPAVCWGLDEGLLTSATTRWPGLITNMDVAPTILELLGIEHNQPLIGRPVTVMPLSEDEGRLRLARMVEKIGFFSQYRGQVLRTLVIGQIITYAAVLISLIANSASPPWVVRILQLAILLLLAMPLSLLLWDRFPFAVLAILAGIAVLKCRNVSTVLLIGLVSFSTAAAISADVLLGSWLMRYSFLGYDPVGGARFYGIGNEFMGVLIGSAIMGWAIAAEKGGFSRSLRGALGLVLFSFFTVVIGAPALGTNVGGFISAVFGFGSTFLAMQGRRVNMPTILALGAAALAVLAMLMLVDGAHSPGEQSHIGQTVELIRRDGVNAVILIIARKLSMNLRLLRYSMWSNALIVALVGIGASFIWPSRYIFWLKENHPLIAGGIMGVVIGSTAAFVFNDSGVVAAATCLSFASSTLLILALELKHDLAAPQTNIEDNGHCH
ncbi:MAG: hypothetical protein QM372_04190 [Bacillota bacterium]|jgi:hypothetical protein|nr:hypothetical protein [Bacillota bacterium]